VAQWSAAGCGREKLGSDGVLTGRPGWYGAGRREFKRDLKQNPNSNASNKFQTASNFGRLETYFPELKKIEIKYGWKALEIRINVSYRNFFIFEMEIGIKIQRIFYG
jgi:hypothetical protein